MNPAQFRQLFPALTSSVWLDTPAAPPGAAPVVRALHDVVSAWSRGEFDQHAWDAAVGRARELFGQLAGADPAAISAHGSLAEAAATVARALPGPGEIVVAAEEFHSNLFPWLALERDGRRVVTVPARRGVSLTEDLAGAVTRRTVLLAVSEVTSREGQRLDLPALRAATDRVSARLFVNLTQSLGALRFDPDLVRPDYLAAHGYKWLLCPRGAAWLATRPDRVGELRPLAPSWKSTGPPYAYFGGPLRLAGDAARCDASPAWFSWIGASAALRLFGQLDACRVERHCLGLAAEFTTQAAAMGLRRVSSVPASQIVVLGTDHAERLASRLRQRGIRVT
ncbi:MAG TPA: aminotransferase class V-fold PLP-dependent enzyme, partial [Streptosporangiaceae bacterium]